MSFLESTLFIASVCVCMSHPLPSYILSKSPPPPLAAPSHPPSLLVSTLRPYISLLTDPLRCCQPRHLPFKCQQTHAICLHLSTKHRCVFVWLCVRVCVLFPVYACKFLCPPPPSVCTSGVMVSDEVAGSPNKREHRKTICLTGRQRKKKTQ